MHKAYAQPQTCTEEMDWSRTCACLLPASIGSFQSADFRPDIVYWHASSQSFYIVQFKGFYSLLITGDSRVLRGLLMH